MFTFDMSCTHNRLLRQEALRLQLFVYYSLTLYLTYRVLRTALMLTAAGDSFSSNVDSFLLSSDKAKQGLLSPGGPIENFQLSCDCLTHPLNITPLSNWVIS